MIWLANDARELPQQIEKWQAAPVKIYAKFLRVRVTKNRTEPVRTHFIVNSYHDITVKTVADNAAITTWPMQSPDNDGRQMIGVEIAASAFPKAAGEQTKAGLTISFAEFPDTVLHLPVIINFED